MKNNIRIIIFASIIIQTIFFSGCEIYFTETVSNFKYVKLQPEPDFYYAVWTWDEVDNAKEYQLFRTNTTPDTQNKQIYLIGTTKKTFYFNRCYSYNSNMTYTDVRALDSSDNAGFSPEFKQISESSSFTNLSFSQSDNCVTWNKFPGAVKYVIAESSSESEDVYTKAVPGDVVLMTDTNSCTVNLNSDKFYSVWLDVTEEIPSDGDSINTVGYYRLSSWISGAALK